MSTSIHFPHRVRLANLPTPIYRLNRLSQELGGVEIYIKRDDLTGMEFSGNKIRKLEFVCGKALAEGNNVLITCGGLQSNHARATAAAAARLGLKSHLVLSGSPPAVSEGNYWLDQLFGAELTLVPPNDKVTLPERMKEIASTYLEKGDHPLIIPLGASDATGCWGYIQEGYELAEQFNQLGWQPDAIFLATGSGGTQAGLILGSTLFDIHSQVIGISVSESSSYFTEKISRILGEFNAEYQYHLDFKPEDIRILDGYVGAGYGSADRPLLEFIKHTARTEAVLLDPVYTGKAFFGMVNEIKKGHFNSHSRILFIHTGGFLGLIPFGPLLVP